MKSGNILAGKYRLVQRIGVGAMGEVWAAENQETGLAVALKFIIPSAPQQRTADLRHRLIREAKACRKLSHRNIVQILDLGETPEGDPFLVLELLQGQTLEDRLKDTRRIEPAMAARMGVEIAKALGVAHEAQLVHRDLKPANIFLHREPGMLDDDFVVKVLDFGVSKHLEGGEGPATITNVAVGSPAYMSPEQVAMRKDLDGRSDIWSLGIVLYEMLAGVRPFVGTVPEVVRQIALAHVNKIPPPSAKVRSVPPELDELVARCMQPDRNARYANASEVAQALASAAEASRNIRLPTNLHVAAIANQSTALATPTVELQPALAARAPVAAASPVHAAIKNAVTLPLQSGPLHGMNAVREKPALQPMLGAAGTQVMGGSQPVASPAPTWKKEMKEWRAQRQSSTGTETLVSEEAAQGGTQALDPDVVMRATADTDRTSTTSGIGALSQPTGSYPTFSPTNAPGVTSAKQRRKRNSKVFMAMIAVGIVAALAIVAVLLFNTSPAESETHVDASQDPVHSAARSRVPVELKSVAPPQPSITAPTAPSSTESPTRASTPPRVPTAVVAPAAAKPRASAPKSVPAAPPAAPPRKRLF